MAKDTDYLANAIAKVATGYEYSRDLKRDEAKNAMLQILHGEADEVQAAIFLIALRMKRETEAENLGLQDALRCSINTVSVDIPQLLSISDPYDGVLRSCPVSTFLPAVIAACGLPAYLHGVDRIGPKYGVTHAQVLEALGYSSKQSQRHLAERLAHSDVGWGYVDLSVFSPVLAGLTSFRNRIIKRTALSTLERVHMPFSAKDKTILMTAYVHKAYPETYLSLARNAGFDAAVTFRGYEGTVIPPLHQTVKLFGYQESMGLDQLVFEAKAYGINKPLEKAGSRSVEKLAAHGMAALRGEKNNAYHALRVSGALALLATGALSDQGAAIEKITRALDSGSALARFRAGLV